MAGRWVSDCKIVFQAVSPLRMQPERRLIAALNTEGEWQIKAIENWGPPLAESYVQIMEPGLYQRSDAASKPAAELDLLQTIQSDAPGFATGKFNGRFAAYFLQDNDWRRVWLRD